MLMASFFALIALLEGWSLVRAWRTGRISSRGWSFQRSNNPTGFWLIAFVDVAILIGCLGFALHLLASPGKPVH